MPKFLEMEWFAKTNGMVWTHITKKHWIITKEQAITCHFGRWFLRSIIRIICWNNSTKSFTKQSKHFKARKLLMVRFTWRIYKWRGMETLLCQYLNHTHKRNKILHNIDLSQKSFMVMITQLRSNFQMNNKLHVLRKRLMLWTLMNLQAILKISWFSSIYQTL